jgi:hypothetical protein
MNYGPGSITFGGVTFYSQADIIINEVCNTNKFSTSIHGTAHEAVKDIYHEISLVHDGRVVSGQLAVLTKYAGVSVPIGTGIFADNALVIHGVAGDKRTYHNAALVQMPNLKLSSQALAWGQMQFVAIHKSDTALSADNSLYTDATESYTQGAFTSTDMILGPYTINWGSTFVDVYPKDGVDISFALQLDDEMSDSRGLVQKILRGCTVSASFTPDEQGQSFDADDLSALLKHQGTGAGIGKIKTTADSLVFAGSGFTVTMPRAAAVSGQRGYGARRRQGALSFVSSRVISGGALSAALTLAKA